MRPFGWIVALGLVVAGAACDSSESESAADAKAGEAVTSKVVYACNAPSENTSNCVEWRGGAFPDEASAKAECSANRGQFAGAACPSENHVATCVRHKGTVMEQHELWYGPKMTAEAVKSGCQGADTEFVPK